MTLPWDRARALVDRHTAARGEGLVHAGGDVLVHGGDGERLDQSFFADRDRTDELEADAIAALIVEAIEADEPALKRRIRWHVWPRAAPDPEADRLAALARAFLHAELDRHEPGCAEHHDRPLFVAEVERVVGWRPIEDHLRATFCVDSSATGPADEKCCARAVAALTAAHPELAELLWTCTTWK